jgi:hypothetical protein
VPHVFVSANGPVTAIFVIARGTAPELVKLTCCGSLVVPGCWVTKVRLVGVSEAVAVLPVPIKATVRGLPAELSVIVNVPVRVPATVGVNVTCTGQVPPAAVTVVQDS